MQRSIVTPPDSLLISMDQAETRPDMAQQAVERSGPVESSSLFGKTVGAQQVTDVAARSDDPGHLAVEFPQALVPALVTRHQG